MSLVKCNLMKSNLYVFDLKRVWLEATGSNNYDIMSLLNFIRKASKLNVNLFFGIAFFLLLSTNLILSYLFSFGTSNSNVNYIEHFGKVITLLVVVLWAPVFETILYQVLIIHLTKAFVSKIRYSFFISIFISSMAFGLSHPYSLPYIFAASIAGLIFATTYYISLYRKQSAFLLVFLLHALNNFLGLLIFLHK